MATNENLIPIPGRLHSVASDEIVSGANEIYDDKLLDNQENLNTGFTNDIDTIYNTIGDNNKKGAIMEQLNTIDGRLDTIDGEISALNHIPIEVVQLNPSTGEPNVNNPEGNILYRASNSDQTSYSDWMYKEDDHEWVMIFEQQTPSEQEKLVGYYTCNTTADQPEKSIGDTGYVLPINGGAMKIKMTNANTADNATLRIGSETAKPLWYNDERASSNNTWDEGEVISVYYDGENYKASNAMGGGSAVGKKKLKGNQGYVVLTGTTAPNPTTSGGSTAQYRYIQYPVKEGDVVEIKGKGNGSAWTWALIDTTNNRTIVESSNGIADYTNVPFVKVIPSGVDMIIINNYITGYADYEWYYAKAGSVGAHEMLTEAYLYGDLRTFEVGKSYNKDEPVKSANKQFLRINKEIKEMSLTEEVFIGDLRTSDNNTYRAQKAVTIYNKFKTYSDGDYSIGLPSTLILTLGERDTANLSIEFDDKTATINPATFDSGGIATALTNALNSVEEIGWTFTVDENGKLVATSVVHGNLDLVPITFTDTSGVSATGEKTQEGEADETAVDEITQEETVINSGLPTILEYTITVNDGSIKLNVDGLQYVIPVTSTDNNIAVATTITNIEITGIKTTQESNSITFTWDEVGNHNATVIALDGTELGITGTVEVINSGNNSLNKYSIIIDNETQESIGTWSPINTFATYTSDTAVWTILTIDDLLSYTSQNTSIQDFQIPVEEDEYVIAKKFNQLDKDFKTLSENSVNVDELIKDEYVISKAIIQGLGNGGSGGSSGGSGYLSCANSDIINVIGSSYTDGGHVLAGKNWVHRIAELSDYQYNNDGLSGASYYSQLNGNYQSKSIRYNGYCIGKYVILNNNENMGDISYISWFKSLDNMVRVCLGLGIEPILATNWSQGSNFSNVSLMYENYARDHNLIYMNGNDYSRTLYDATKYGRWSAGTHLGTRIQGVFSDAYLPYLQRMERPMKSMKIFRLRAAYNTSNLDALMFTDNTDRLRYFREIWCGHKACSQSTVDNHPDVYPHTGGDGCPNQYETLRKGNSISFTNAALISAVIPYTGKTITSLQFQVTVNTSVEVYVKNALAKPYAASTSYTRFNIAEEIDTVPQTGAIYSDGVTNFTVSYVVMGENGSYCTIYMENWTDGNQEGTLTKVSGTGSSNIPYNIRESYSIGSIAGDTCGHWVKIEKSGNKYDLTDIADKVLDYDKLNILIVGESFTISEPRIYYSGEYQKSLHRKYYTFIANADNPNTEMIQEPTFGEVGTTLSTWADDNNNALTSVANYGLAHPEKSGADYLVDMPNGLRSILVVDNNNSINTTISSTSYNMMLEIYARYFAPIYTDGSGNQITYESYDYEDLFVQLGDSSTGALISKQVGLMWKIIQIPLKRVRAGKLRIYGGPKGIEIAKVSLKKIQNYETY